MSQSQFQRIFNLVDLERFLLADVGASGGIDPKWKILGDRLCLVGFEPDKEEHEKLSNSQSGRSFNIALADKQCQQEFFVCKKQEVSACFRPNVSFLKRFPMPERFNVEKTISVETDSLDNVLASHSIERVDFMKIDTQGYELNILKGARQALGKVSGLEVEVEFSMLYEGQPLFGEIDAYLRNLGFVLFDLRPCYWKRIEKPFMKGAGQIIFADALYFKDYITMDSIPESVGLPIVMAVIYRKYDYAIELIEYLCRKNRISRDKKGKIISILYELSKPVLKIPNFRGKAKLINYLENVVNLLRCTTHWSRYDSWK
jgi:FkbM family methyltransferase